MSSLRQLSIRRSHPPIIIAATAASQETEASGRRCAGPGGQWLVAELARVRRNPEFKEPPNRPEWWRIRLRGGVCHSHPSEAQTPGGLPALIGSLPIVAAFAGTRVPGDRTLASAATKQRHDAHRSRVRRNAGARRPHSGECSYKTTARFASKVRQDAIKTGKAQVLDYRPYQYLKGCARVGSEAGRSKSRGRPPTTVGAASLSV